LKQTSVFDTSFEDKTIWRVTRLQNKTVWRERLQDYKITTREVFL